MSKRTYFRHVVLQPTTLCNLNCSYCYLPDRALNKPMNPDVAKAVANSLSEIEHPISVVWHGSEPLAAGVEKFQELLEPFSSMHDEGRVSHSVQTNATLVNEEWCDLFRRFSFGVGVSLDGNRDHNSERLTWGGKESFDKVMRGLELLRQHDIPFSVIAVVSSSNIVDAHGLYSFFTSLGCTALNINVEEQEGLNALAEPLARSDVEKFWQDLFHAWLSDPVIKIREISNVLAWLENATRENEEYHYSRDFWPTVAENGDVVVLSPEFVAASSDVRGDFVVGNVLERDLCDIVEESLESWYVRDFFTGVSACQQSCDYYEFCGGGQASNKYFEHGRIDTTETAHCRNTRQLVVDTALKILESPGSPT